MHGDVVDFAKRQWSTPATRLLRPDPLREVTAKRNFVVALDLFQSCLCGFFGVHKQECLHSEIDDVTMASNPLLLCLPIDTFPPQMLAEQTTELVVGTMIIAGVEAD